MARASGNRVSRPENGEGRQSLSPLPPFGLSRSARRSALRRLEIHRLGAACVRFGVEAYALTFIERPHSSALDRGDMDEYVLAAAVWRDEAKALCGVEKFDRAGLRSHACSS